MKIAYWCLFAVLILAPHILRAQPDSWEGIEQSERPWVNNDSRPYSITQGLNGRHVALWASHGIFYDLEKGKWRWQRPPLYTTCEDLFTQTIVVPFLIPMLENAGAVVFTPRERDWQRHEIIVDNDSSSASQLFKTEPANHNLWMKAPLPGFAMHEGNYLDGENPFASGTAAMIETTRNKAKAASAIYQPYFPEAGRYAVYVSYQTVPASIDDASYTVWHQGIKTVFSVNQRMGGSTWVYLGSFDFDEGSSPRNCVIVSNVSQRNGMLTTDAVRFGGGMGNIERGGSTSGMPRCLESARYYAQWAGMPYQVYSSKDGTNDYADDINARSLMVNHLCGGSTYAPDSFGRRVPIELSLAVHSDAGYNKPSGEGIFGTLSICTTQQGDSLLASGRSRKMSLELAQDLLDNTARDLQQHFDTWTTRGIYDRNYSETRLPIVPSAILETLSHQSFQDMRYGLDPYFRFMLARSIYKTLLRYISRKHQQDYTVTPLMPHHFRIELSEAGDAHISWSATTDAYEATAQPSGYLLYTSTNDNGFDNGTYIKGTSTTLHLQPGILYHFRVAAVNKGGQSFSTPVLSACFHSKSSKNILIVDGFHRLSSPAVCKEGFALDEDFGIDYGRSCGTLGRQQVFDPNRIGIEDSTGLGYTSDELAGKLFAGHEFNYVRAHAQAIYKAGNYNIVSCSSEAIDRMPLYQYHLIDLALGLERDDGYSMKRYKTFLPSMQNALSQFAAQGGRLLVSGAYVGSDMQADDERMFINEVLKCQWAGINHSSDNTVKGLGVNMSIFRQPNEKHYAAPHTDILMPSVPQAFCAMAYADGTSAAIAYEGNNYKTFVMGFPLECIEYTPVRNAIMKGLLNFLLQ